MHYSTKQRESYLLRIKRENNIKGLPNFELKFSSKGSWELVGPSLT